MIKNYDSWLLESADNSIGIDKIAENFLEWVYRNFEPTKTFDREAGNCAWFTKVFIDWASERGINCKIVYFPSDSDAHTAVLLGDKILDFTYNQFTGSGEKYKIGKFSDYEKFGYKNHEIYDKIPSWFTIHPLKKLHESNNFSSEQLRWCQDHLFKDGEKFDLKASFSISAGGDKIKVVAGNLIIKDEEIEQLPVTFDDLHRDLTIYCPNLRTLKGLPERCAGLIVTENSHLTSLDFLPKMVDRWSRYKFGESRKTSTGVILVSEVDDVSEVLPNLDRNQAIVMNDIMKNWQTRETWLDFRGSFPDFCSQNKGKIKARVAGLI